MVDWLPHVNASLNALATVLLIAGVVLIRSGKEKAHKRTMLSCFAVSAVFLICYLIYHALAGSKKFPAEAADGIRYFYFVMLISHIVLAAAVPVLAIWTILLGLNPKRRAAHRRLARWTFPIWLYVSVTGVLLYVMLYHYAPTLTPGS